MLTTLTPDAATLDELGRANIKRVLAGRRLEVYGANAGTRERLLLSWRPRCRGDGAGGVMFLCFQNRAQLAKSDRPTAPGPPSPSFRIMADGTPYLPSPRLPRGDSR